MPLTHIPYRGSAPATNDLMGGQVVALMESLPTRIGYFTSGRMRPLAVSESERSPSLPDVPTFREAGFTGVVTTNWFGVRPGTLGIEGYTALVRSEFARWREVIRAANIRAD